MCLHISLKNKDYNYNFVTLELVMKYILFLGFYFSLSKIVQFSFISMWLII